MEIVWMIIVGFIAGALAKFIMPGRDPGGFLLTTLLGIAGSLVGGFLARQFGVGGGEQYAGLIGSVIGAIILLALYRMFAGRSTTT